MTTHLAVCGVGGALAMIGHFPRRGRFWVPHALGLAAMALALLPGGAPFALALLAAVLGGQLRTLPPGPDRWTGCSDTLAMAGLITLLGLAARSEAGGPGGAAMAGMHHGPDVAATVDGGRLALALLVLVGWLLVRVWTWLREDTVVPGPRPVEAARGRRLRASAAALRSCGGLVMLAAMTTMVV